MVWPSQKLSFDRKLSFSRKKTKSKRTNEDTLQKEPIDGRSPELTKERKSPSSNWPSIVLKDTRKHETHNHDEKIPANESSNGIRAQESDTAWPSSVVLDDEKHTRRDRRQHHSAETEETTTMNHDTPQSDLWPSLVVEDKMRTNGSDPVSEDRNERGTSRMGQIDERDGVSIGEHYTPKRRLEPSGHVRSPKHDHLSNSSSSSSEDDDETGSYGSNTYDSKSYGTSTTLQTRSFDTRNLEIGCFVDKRKMKTSTFNPAVPPREAKSNNIVAALVHLTTQCYAPSDALL